jgi:hypothetical protein
MPYLTRHAKRSVYVYVASAKTTDGYIAEYKSMTDVRFDYKDAGPNVVYKQSTMTSSDGTTQHKKCDGKQMYDKIAVSDVYIPFNDFTTTVAQPKTLCSGTVSWK